MVIKFFKDLLFPIFCEKCGKEGEWLCDNCLAKEKLTSIKKCPYCEINNSGKLCFVCKDYCQLDGAFSFFEYNEKSPLTKLIFDFKYKYIRDISGLWKKIIKKNIHQITALCGADEWTIVAVPLFKKRENERGFNQSAIIAKIIFEELKKINSKIQYSNKILKRHRSTIQQAKLKKEDREKNVQGAFLCGSSELPNNIFLIDDVFTTGSTLFECARVLKASGIKKIWAITLARTN